MEILPFDTYSGWIVEEGLINPLNLNKLEIKFSSVHLGKSKKDSKLIYHTYGVEISGIELQKLPNMLHKKWHYAKFYHKDEVVMVFPNKICVIDKKSEKGLEEAIAQTKKLQIDQEHIDNISSVYSQ